MKLQARSVVCAAALIMVTWTAGCDTENESDGFATPQPAQPGPEEPSGEANGGQPAEGGLTKNDANTVVDVDIVINFSPQFNGSFYCPNGCSGSGTPPGIMPEIVNLKMNVVKNTLVAVDFAAYCRAYPEVRVVLEQGPVHGRANVGTDGRSILYAPNLGYVGTDSVTYSFLDNNGLQTETGTITFHVNNRAPVADDILTGVQRGGVLTQTLTATDPDPLETLTYSLLVPPAGGTLTEFTPEGRFTYQSLAGVPLLQDQFSVEVSDGTDATTFRVIINIFNTPPEIGESLTVEMPKNDIFMGMLPATDLNQDSLTFALTDLPANGMATLTDSATGSFTYEPNSDYIGPDQFTYTVTDAFGAEVVGLVAITITNTAPSIDSTPVTSHQVLPEPGDSVTIPVTIRDFQASHPDMQTNIIEVQTGLVLQNIGADGLPVFSNTALYSPRSIQDAHTFNQWYRDTAGINQTIHSSLTLTKQADGVYQYTDTEFFPINGQGFDVGLTTRNYHFTLAMESAFTYQGTETFEFFGDDDLWVFINGQLVVDIGGVHPSHPGSVDLPAVADEIGLEVGKIYSFQLFFAERNTVASAFQVETGIKFFPNAPYRYQVQASDPDINEVLVYSVVNGPAGMQINATTGEVLWAPTAADVGSYPITLAVTDASGATTEQSYTLEVVLDPDYP